MKTPLFPFTPSMNTLTPPPLLISFLDAEKLVNLVQLDLSINSLTSLPPLFPLKKLEILDLSGNQLSTFPHRTLGQLALVDASADVLDPFPVLTALDLSCNWYRAIPPVVTELLSLKSLNMSMNRFSPANREDLEAIFPKISGVLEFTFEENEFPVPEVVTQCLKANRARQEAGFRAVQQELKISSPGLSLLPHTFSSFDYIRKLSLQGLGLIQLDPALQNFKRLTSLDVSNNHLTILPQILLGLPDLVELK